MEKVGDLTVHVVVGSYCLTLFNCLFFNLGCSCGDFLLLTASCRKSRVFCTLQNAELVKLKSLGYTYF